MQALVAAPSAPDPQFGTASPEPYSEFGAASPGPYSEFGASLPPSYTPGTRRAFPVLGVVFIACFAVAAAAIVAVVLIMFNQRASSAPSPKSIGTSPTGGQASPQPQTNTPNKQTGKPTRGPQGTPRGAAKPPTLPPKPARPIMDVLQDKFDGKNGLYVWMGELGGSLNTHPEIDVKSVYPNMPRPVPQDDPGSYDYDIPMIQTTWIHKDIPINVLCQEDNSRTIGMILDGDLVAGAEWPVCSWQIDAGSNKRGCPKYWKNSWQAINCSRAHIQCEMPLGDIKCTTALQVGCGQRCDGTFAHPVTGEAGYKCDQIPWCEDFSEEERREGWGPYGPWRSDHHRMCSYKGGPTAESAWTKDQIWLRKGVSFTPTDYTYGENEIDLTLKGVSTAGLHAKICAFIYTSGQVCACNNCPGTGQSCCKNDSTGYPDGETRKCVDQTCPCGERSKALALSMQLAHNTAYQDNKVPLLYLNPAQTSCFGRKNGQPFFAGWTDNGFVVDFQAAFTLVKPA